ncbi:MAG: hypothetical protein ACRDIF_01525 [Actinomycetota bacterium]
MDSLLEPSEELARLRELPLEERAGALAELADRLERELDSPDSLPETAPSPPGSPPGG